jgi:hypothetical protein
MNFGQSRELSEADIVIESFIENLSEELNLIHVYLYDMKEFFIQKQTQINDEVQYEECEIKASILGQPNYKLYDKKFNDLVYKNIFITLISIFENKLLELLEELKHQNIIKNKFEKPKNRIIINGIKHLARELKLSKLQFEKIELFILVRNHIIHEDSQLKNIIKHQYYNTIENNIRIEGSRFYFDDLKLSLSLLNEIKAFFNNL